MTRTLAIETSSRPFSVAIGMNNTGDLVSALGEELPVLVTELLEEAGATLADIEKIIVCVGPGGLGAVRCGVAFANALAWAGDLAILPLPSFTVLGHTVGRDAATLSLASAADRKCYGGLVRPQDEMTDRPICGFGPMPDVLAKLSAEIPQGQRIYIAGRHRAEACEILRDQGCLDVIDTNVDRPLASDMIALSEKFGANHTTCRPPVLPLNDHSQIFQQ